MNAITALHAAKQVPLGEGADLALEYIPLTSIRKSTTAVQALRRSGYNAQKLLELAASIQTNGVLQPILVKPIAIDLDVAVQFEIVAGERRWIAADRAGLAHIPCVIRDLDTVETLQAQLVENIGRAELSALEEATGFREMLDKGSLLTAESVGERIGKSRSYVYARLKLLDLIPAVRAAMADGSLDATKALVIARIKGEKMQARALKLVIERGQYFSYRQLMDKLRSEVMIPITQAPWLQGDRDTLHLPKTGDPVQRCDTCLSRSCNDPDLQDELDGADVCVDQACFELKTKLHWARVRKDYEAQGRQIITGDAVKELIDTIGHYPASVYNGFVRLDAECDTIEFTEPEPKPKKGQSEDDLENDPDWQAWSQRREDFESPDLASLVGELPDTQLVQTSQGLVPVAPVAAVVKALKAKGIDIPWRLKPSAIREQSKPETDEDRQRAAAERAKEEERTLVETEYRARLLTQIHAKWKPPLKKHDLEYIAEAMLEGAENSDAYDTIYGLGRPDIAKMKEPDLQRWMVIYAISHECDEWQIRGGHKPAAMLDYAQRLKIDPKKLRAEVVKELRPTSAATEPAAGKAKKKGAKA